MKRRTIQKQLALDAVRSVITHPTADEIYDILASRCPTISRGTVYRNLNGLAEEGLIRRVMIANAPDRFDKTTVPHAHFRCKLCGRVFDYETTQGVDTSEALNPDYEVEDFELLFIGRCKNCKTTGGDCHGQ